MVVVVELIKLLLVSTKETEGEKQTKKNHLLEQAANVLNWMYEFDPENVQLWRTKDSIVTTQIVDQWQRIC